MELNEQMPEFFGATAWINNEVTKKKLLNKPTFVHFWSSNSQLCKEAFEEINGYRDQFNDKLNIVAVHLPNSDEEKKIEVIENIVRKYNITQPVFVDNNLELVNAYAIKDVPAYYVFDIAGELRHFQSGDSDLKILETKVNDLLDEMRKETEK